MYKCSFRTGTIKIPPKVKHWNNCSRTVATRLRVPVPEGAVPWTRGTRDGATALRIVSDSCTRTTACVSGALDRSRGEQSEPARKTEPSFYLNLP